MKNVASGYQCGQSVLVDRAIDLHRDFNARSGYARVLDCITHRQAFGAHEAHVGHA
jgi:hypothetical protein